MTVSVGSSTTSTVSISSTLAVKTEQRSTSDYLTACGCCGRRTTTRGALNALNAELSREAAALAGLAALQYARDGRPWRELATPVRGALASANLDGVIDGLTAAFHDLNGYRFGECLIALDRLPRDLPKTWLAG